MASNQRVLITTVPVSEIAGQARVHNKPVTYNNARECFAAANNIEYINGFTCPNYATEFIRANIPSADILEFPTWEKYENAVRSGYDIVGISFWTYTSKIAARMAEIARSYGTKQVWGGGHGINTPGIGKYFNRLYSGYGEFHLKEALEHEPLKTFKHPIMASEYDFYLTKVRTGYLFSIRGCQMACEFCSGPRYYQRIVKTPIEEVERVLDTYLKMDIRHITLVDETFLQNAAHARKVIEAMHKRGMTFSATSRADLFRGNIKALREKGMRSIYLGIESLNDLSLDSVKKGTSSSHIMQVFNELIKNDSFAFATYMIGFENDTPQNVKENLEKLKAIKGLFAVQFWITTPFPGTPFYERLDGEGKIINKNWEDYDAMHMIWQHPHMSPGEVESLLEYAIRNYCNSSDIKKKKILRAWEKYEKAAGCCT